MIDTVIFDLDGTLLDTVDDLLDSVNYALNYYNYPKKTKEEVRLAVGDGLSVLMKRVLPEGEPIIPPLQKFKEYYIGLKTSKTAPYEGIIELLSKLKEKSYKTGVLSNKFDRGCKRDCKKFFGSLIDYAQGEDEPNGIIRKPNPKGLFKVIETLNSKIENTIFIGDSDVDINAAKNAGVPCISVLWGLKSEKFLKSMGAKIFAKTPLEILDILDRLFSASDI